MVSASEKSQTSDRAFTIPTVAVILSATFLSTCSSMAGGLIMYFKGLEALEDSVSDTSLSEVRSMKEKLRAQLLVVEHSAQTLKKVMYNTERIHTNNPEEWASIIRSLAYAQVSGSDVLYDSTMSLATYDTTNSSAFYAGVWGDVLKNGSRELVFGAYGNHLNVTENFLVANGTVQEMLIPSYSLHSDTGHVNEFVYNWDGNPRYIDIIKHYDPRNGKDNKTHEEFLWTDPPVAGSVCSRWFTPRRWYASDGNMYAYTELEAIYIPPPPPHPWSTYKSVSMLVGFLFESFQPPFEEYKAEHPDTHFLLIEEDTGTIYASTEGGMIPKACQVQASLAENEDVALGCSLTLKDLSPAIQEAAQYLSRRGYGHFAKASFDGTEYFVRKEHSHQNLQLVWMRAASSVQGKVQEALTYLIIFTLLVLLFDVTISVAEVVFIALPMKRLSRAIRSVADMECESAEDTLQLISCAPLSEVAVMRRATSMLVSNMAEYKTFLPSAMFAPEGKQSVRQRDAPGKESGAACIVFTDIKGSTQLWELCHDGMTVGLHLHNEVIRSCIVAHNGYEVKTIGDAFMVAFDTMHDGLRFSLSVQEELTKVAWPETLLASPLCAADAKGDWVGIRVRIGVNYGPVCLEHDPNLRRYDYLGPTVNRAARLESTCVGGAVAATDELLVSVPSIGDDAVVIQVGRRVLKGIAQPVEVSMLVPKSLPRRARQVTILSRQDVLAPSVGSVHMPGSSDTDDSGSYASSEAKKNRKGARMEALFRFTETLSSVGSATSAYLSENISEGTPQEITMLVNSLVTRVASCVERSDGTLLTVVGSSVAVGWNVTKKCTNHIESGFRFAGIISRQSGDKLRCGMSSSAMLAGYVGTSGQRFVTAVGSSSTRAAAIVYISEPLGVRFAYTSRSERVSVESLCSRGFVRPVSNVVCAGKAIVLYEMNLPKLQEWCSDKVLTLFGNETEVPEFDPECSLPFFTQEKCWSTAYCAAYQEQNFEVLEKMALVDAGVIDVVKRLRSGDMCKGTGAIPQEESPTGRSLTPKGSFTPYFPAAGSPKVPPRASPGGPAAPSPQHPFIPSTL